MRLAKLCLANLIRGGESGIRKISQRGEAELRATHSQAELGNDKRTGGRLGTTGATGVLFALREELLQGAQLRAAARLGAGRQAAGHRNGARHCGEIQGALAQGRLTDGK